MHINELSSVEVSDALPRECAACHALGQGQLAVSVIFKDDRPAQCAGVRGGALFCRRRLYGSTKEGCHDRNGQDLRPHRYAHPDPAQAAAGWAVISTIRWECLRSEEHTSELQSLLRLTYAVFC